MPEQRVIPACILGYLSIIGLSALGFLLGKALLNMKQLEPSATFKGSSENAYQAKTVI